MKTWHHVQKLSPGVWLLGEPGQVNAYLVQGAEYAALIDTGTGIGDIRAVAESITDRPVVVLNTQGHWDHIGGNHRFEHIGVHPLEAGKLSTPQIPDSAIQHLRRLASQGAALPAGTDLEEHSLQPSQASFSLEQGMEIELGGRRLQIWHTPGHTPGAICLLDEENRLVFSGDTLLEGAISLHLPESSVEDMLDSLNMLAQVAWEINLVFPAHGSTPIAGRRIGEAAEALRRVVAGEAQLKKGFSIHGAVRVAAFEPFMFFLPADWQPAGK